MGATYTGFALASYRDEVEQLVRARTPFAEVERVIDMAVGLSEEAKAALWLLAFSLRDRGEQLREARGYIEALTGAED